MQDVQGKDLPRSEERRRRLDARAAAVLRATAIVSTEVGISDVCDVLWASTSQTVF